MAGLTRHPLRNSGGWRLGGRNDELSFRGDSADMLVTEEIESEH